MHLSLRVGPHPHALSLGGAPMARCPPAPRSGRVRLFLNVIDFPCAEALQKRTRAVPVELLIGRFDRQKEPILARVCSESFDIEYGVIRHREPIEREHPEYR